MARKEIWDAIERVRGRQDGFETVEVPGYGAIDIVWGERGPDPSDQRDRGGFGLVHIEYRRGIQGEPVEETFAMIAEVLVDGRRIRTVGGNRIKTEFEKDGYKVVVRDDYDQSGRRVLLSAYRIGAKG